MADSGWRRNKYGGWFNINDIKSQTNKYMNEKIRREADKKKYNDDNFKYLSDDDDEAYDEYIEMSTESNSKLLSEELYNIENNYLKTEESYAINEALREDRNSTENLNSQEFQKLVKDMDKACLTYKSSNDMASTRFVNMDYLRNAYGLDIPRYGDIDRSLYANEMKKYIDSEISSKGYTSVSLNESGNGIFNNLAVQMKINMPSGTSMYVADNVGEYEAILGRNTKMKLKDVGFKESKIAGFEKEYGKILLTYEVIENE